MQTQIKLQEQLKKKMNRNLDEALQTLTEIFAKDQTISHQVAVVLARHSKLKADSNMGLLLKEEERVELAKIFSSTVGFINMITEEVATEYDLKTAIFSQILVICTSTERVEFMKKVFSTTFYKRVEYNFDLKPLPAEDINKFDLIIYDNEPFVGDNDPHELLRHYLNLSPERPYLLYFGQNLKLLYEYPQKAYFANSVFSIHARIQEMMTFIKYYQEAP